jgi:hypothetical protein
VRYIYIVCTPNILTLITRSTTSLLFGKGLLATLGLSFDFLLSMCLFRVEHEGDHHRKQRKMLNPVFSIAHMREMSEDVYHSPKNTSYRYL